MWRDYASPAGRMKNETQQIAVTKAKKDKISKNKSNQRYRYGKDGLQGYLATIPSTAMVLVALFAFIALFPSKTTHMFIDSKIKPAKPAKYFNTANLPFPTQKGTYKPKRNEILLFPIEIWMNALRLSSTVLIVLMMLILPSHLKTINRSEKRMIQLYIFTSFCAALQGTLWVCVISPGNFKNQIELMHIMMNDDSFLGLPIILMIVGFFCIGYLIRSKTRIVSVCHTFLFGCKSVISWILWLTPFGVTLLIGNKIIVLYDDKFTQHLQEYSIVFCYYILTILIGHSIHVLVFYQILLFITKRINGYKYLMKIYSTSSKSSKIASVDGISLHFPIIILFTAQINGVTLNFNSIISVLILSVIISIGIPPIRNIKLLGLVLLFRATGLENLATDGIIIWFVLGCFTSYVEKVVGIISEWYVNKILIE